SKAVGITADNAEPSAAERLVAAGVARFGRLDGALISVGGPPPGTVTDTSDADWQHAFESIFLGGLRIARAVARAVGEGGSIAFVLSSSVRAPIPGLAISNGMGPGLGVGAQDAGGRAGAAWRAGQRAPPRQDRHRANPRTGPSGRGRAARPGPPGRGEARRA